LTKINRFCFILGISGFFPSDYVERIVMQQQNAPLQQMQQQNGPLQQSQQVPVIASMNNKITVMARVLFNFPGAGQNEMKLNVGDVIEVISRGPPGGWCRGVRGAFPTDYVEMLNFQQNQSISAASPLQSHSALSPSNTNNPNSIAQTRHSPPVAAITPQKSSDVYSDIYSEIASVKASPIQGSSKPTDLLGLSTSSSPISLLDLISPLDILQPKRNTTSIAEGNIIDMYDDVSVPMVASLISLLDLEDPVEVLKPQVTSSSAFKSNNSMSMTQPQKNGFKIDSMMGDNLLSSHSAVSDFPPPIMLSTTKTIDLNKSSFRISPFNALDDMSPLDMTSGMSSSSLEYKSSSAEYKDAGENAMKAATKYDDLKPTEITTTAALPFSPLQENEEKSKANVRPPAPAVKARVVPPVVYARAIYTREADGPTELSLDSGDLILVETKDSEWWYGSVVTSGTNRNSNKGFFPGNYVEVVDKDSIANELAASSYTCANSNNLGQTQISSAFDSMISNSSIGTGQQIQRQSIDKISSKSTTLRLPDSAVNSSSMSSSSSTLSKPSTFMCSLAIGENIPIWRHPVFADLFVDCKFSDPENSISGDTQPRDAKNHAISKMGRALKLVCVSLQKARELFISNDNYSNDADKLKGGHLSRVLLHNISVFNEGSKLCEKIPSKTGDDGFYCVHKFKIKW
jgi:hypothetical protein